MAIKVGEVGKIFNYNTFFDLSSFTLLTLKFTSPSGIVLTLTSADRVSAPAVDASDPFIDANTYMQITSVATDFTEDGIWTVCGIYEDATPKKFDGDDATFPIGPPC